jgi:hypothetical protein
MSTKTSSSISAKALAEAAGILTAKTLQLLLLGTAMAPIAEVAAGAVSGAVKAIIEELAKQNSKTEQLLENVIAEPLKFARQTLEENLTIVVRTKAEIKEQQRQLKTAYDKLLQASFYEDKMKAPVQVQIHLYRAVIAGLMSGGRPYAERYIGELKVTSSLARTEAEGALAEAEEIDPEWFERNRRGLMGIPVDYSDESYRSQGVDKNIEDARNQKSALLQKAANLNKAAEGLERFCRLITALAEERASMLEACEDF